MPQLTEAELKRQLDSEKFSKVYFFYGPEKFLIDKYTQRFLDKAGNVPFPDFNLQRFDGRETAVDTIADAVEALPFLAERKCVTVSDFDVETCGATELGKLYELLDNLPSTTALLLYCPSLEVDARHSAKWKKLIAAVNKAGVTAAMERRTGPELEKTLCAAAAKRGCDLARQNAARIIGFAGSDLRTLYHELEKLCSYQGSGELTAGLIDRLVTRNLEANIFALGRAILAGEYEKAYGLLDLLFYQNEEPVSILAALTTVYLDLYRVRASIQSGLTAQEPAQHFDYKGKEFRLRNAERDVRRLSMAALRESLDILLETDLSLKGARGSRRIMLEKMIARLLLAAQKEKIA